MQDPVDPQDPTGLIREAYRIENLTEGDARVIFFEWVMSLPVDADAAGLAPQMRARYGAGHPDDHPMSRVLAAALREGSALPQARRRGGRARVEKDMGA